MTKNKPILLIAAVAVMSAAATSVQAYSEHWSGFFGGGTITYNNTTYTYRNSTSVAPSYIYAWTYSVSIDSITGLYLNKHTGYFYNADTTDSLIIELVDYGSYKKLLGKKETGTSGTKEGDGTWTGECTNKSFYLRGTWDTYGASEYFNYNLTPPVGNGGWDVTWSSTAGVSGSGTWQMTRTSYSP